MNEMICELLRRLNPLRCIPNFWRLVLIVFPHWVFAIDYESQALNSSVRQFLQQREALYSGDVSIRGLETRVEVRGANRSEKFRNIDQHWQFDYSRGLLRRELAEFPLVDHRNKSDPIMPSVQIFGIDATYHKQVEAKIITIGPKSDLQDVWDLRLTGLATFDDLESKSTFGELDATFRRALDSHQLIHKRLQDGILEMRLYFGQSSENPERVQGLRRIWLDPQKMMAPIRMTEQFSQTAVTIEDELSSEWDAPHSSSVTTWQEVGGEWVPRTSRVQYDRVNPDQSETHIEIDLDFSWHSVNEDLGDEPFSIESLDVPDGSNLIVDGRHGTQSVVIQQPGLTAKQTAKIIKLQEIDGTSARMPSLPFRLAALFLSILLVGFLWFWVRKL